MLSVLRVFVLCVVVAAAAICTGAQDLGSSNRLFGGKAPKASTKTVGSNSRPAAAKKVRPAPSSRPAIAKTRPVKERTSARVEPRRSAVHSEGSKYSTSAAKGAAATVPSPKTVDGRFKAFAGSATTTAKIQKPARAVTDADRRQYERLVQEGDDARYRHNSAGAENAYLRARALGINDARVLAGLGDLYAERERWEDAESAYRTAAEIDPTDASIQIALSSLLARPLPVTDLLERYEASERAARRATELAPRNAAAFDQLGIALESKGLVGPETEGAYRRATELDPSYALAYAHLGRLFRRRGLTGQSDAPYQKAIDRAATAALKVSVAEIMQSELRFQDSETLLRNALGQEPNNYKAALLLGRALATRGKFDEAEPLLRRAATSSPNPYEPNVALATMYLRQGKASMAESALFNAQRSASKAEETTLAGQFEAVGDAYQRMGKRADAARCYRIASTLNSESTTLAGKLTATFGR